LDGGFFAFEIINQNIKKSNIIPSSLPSYNSISRKQTKLLFTTLQEEKRKENILQWFPNNHTIFIPNSHIH
jgi:hypothetical protein